MPARVTRLVGISNMERKIMSRHPHEQNLPDNVTAKDIEKHFGYLSQAIVHCDCCDDAFEEGDTYTMHGKPYCERCYGMINAEPAICNACQQEVDSLTSDGRCRECYLAEEGPQD